MILVPWLLLVFILVGGYGWAAWLIPDDRWLRGCLALAVSVGGLTLLMFWLSLAGVAFEVWMMTLLYAALMLPGWLLWRRRQHVNEPAVALSGWEARGAALAVTLVAAAVLFNAVYWPFSRTDALDIYHAQAVEMTALRGLLPLTGADSLYRAYPMQIQLAYTFIYLASGWTNEYLARLIPALLSLGCLPAAFVLGRMIGGQAAGLWSALLLALAPTFGRWASSGYVDLPMAFFYIMAVIFACRLWRVPNWKSALLAGGLMGLAAWTKNAALVSVPLLALWLAWLGWRGRVGWRLCLASLFACAAVAAPWYVRNLLGAGFLLPDTAWVDQADQSLETLLIFITHPEIFGVPGWIILISWLVSLFRVVIHFRGEIGRGSAALLLLFTVPFFGVWWLFASYDPRFLLLFLPLLAVIGGVEVSRFAAWLPEHWRARLKLPVSALALALTLYMVWISVEFKDDLLRDPLMGDAAKQAIVAGE